jgi:hypothetical protein
MGISWAFVVLLVYPAIQLPLLWVVVRYFGLRNDDGPEDPPGYSFRDVERPSRSCRRCGQENDPAMQICGGCLARLDPGSR